MENSCSELSVPLLQADEEDSIDSKFDCEICLESKLQRDRFTNNKDGCNHGLCCGCMKKYVELTIEDKDDELGATIRCPGMLCENTLDPLSCATVISPALFTKWCDLLCESLVSRYQSCRCPNRKCSALIIDECGDSRSVKQWKCPCCKQLFCFQCRVPWEDEEGNHTCGGNPHLILFKQLAQRRKWKRCPKCRFYVMQTNPCECTSVRCRCGCDFCYRCGRTGNCQQCSDKFRRYDDRWTLSYIIVAAVFLCLASVCFCIALAQDTDKKLHD